MSGPVVLLLAALASLLLGAAIVWTDLYLDELRRRREWRDADRYARARQAVERQQSTDPARIGHHRKDTAE